METVDFNTILDEIFGKYGTNRRNVGMRVLRYCYEHPEWRDRIQTDDSENLGDGLAIAMDKAIMSLYGHSLQYYASASRDREFVDVRKMAMHILRRESRYTYEDIGDIFSKDHATVMACCKSADALIDTDRQFRHDYEQLHEKFIENLQ